MLRRVQEGALDYARTGYSIYNMSGGYNPYEEAKHRIKQTSDRFTGNDKPAPESAPELAKSIGAGVKGTLDARAAKRAEIASAMKRHGPAKALDFGPDMKEPGRLSSAMPRDPNAPMHGVTSRFPAKTVTPPDKPSMARRASVGIRRAAGPQGRASFQAAKSMVSGAMKAGATTVGAGVEGAAYATGKVMDGIKDYHRTMHEADDTGNSSPAPKKEATKPVTGTSTTADTKSTSPAAKTDPKGKALKGPKPQTTVGPKKPKVENPAKKQQAAVKADAQAQPQLTPEQQQQQNFHARAGEFRQRLSAITMVPAAKTGAKPQGMAKMPGAKENFLASILNLREARLKNVEPHIVAVNTGKTHTIIHNKMDEKHVAKRLNSKATPALRAGTPVAHTFWSNDGKHLFHGNPLAMRQKILSEHKRKKFALHTDFPNMNPIQVGSYFDELSDQGMLEDRPGLDPSWTSKFGRKVTRVGKRTGKKVRKFYDGIVSYFKGAQNEGAATKRKGISESESPETAASESAASPEGQEDSFCNFITGNVSHPSECFCHECNSLVRETLTETAGTSFGGMMRGGTRGSNELSGKPLEGNIMEENVEQQRKKEFVIKRLLAGKRGRKRSRVREAFEDVQHDSDFMRREYEQHSKNKEPLALMRRPRTYFSLPETFHKLDRLGMMLATTALIGRNIKPSMALMKFGYNNIPSEFWQDARHASNMIKSHVASGKMFRTRENDEHAPKYLPALHAASKDTDEQLKDFSDNPLAYTHNWTKDKLVRVARKTSINKKYHYPLASAGSAAAHAAVPFLAKMAYDKLHGTAAQP